VSYDDARHAMIRSGASSSFADAVMVTARSFNEGAVWATEPRSPRNTTETTLEVWAQTVFKPVYDSLDANTGARPARQR
jgi:hypothetical protein